MLRVFRTRSGVALLLVFLIIVGILLRSTGNFGIVEDATFTVFAPVQILLLDFSNGVVNLFGGFRDVNTLREQVRLLEEQLSKATIDSVRVRELEIENADLRRQLEYKKANPDLGVFGGSVVERNPDLARVVAQDPSTLVRYVTVDQWRAEGVQVGMPVLTPAGLVGRVSTVGTHWARVLLITDVSSSVNAVVQSTRATGLIQGQGGDLLALRFLPQGESVKENDLVLTSGIG